MKRNWTSYADAERNESGRLAACLLAGWRPGQAPPRLIPVRHAPTVPLGLMPDMIRVATGRRPRRKYVIGKTYGQLRLTGERVSKQRNGKLYAVTCLRCGVSTEVGGATLNQAERRSHSCNATCRALRGAA
jgi:hypothetical protein